MRKIMNCSLVLSLTFLVGFGFNSIHPSTTAENEVLKKINEFHNSIINGDEEKLYSLLGDKMIFNSKYGENEIISSEEYIENLKELGLHINSINSRFFFTEIGNNEIKVSFRMMISFNFGNEQSDMAYKYIYTFKKYNKDWKLISIQLER